MITKFSYDSIPQDLKKLNQWVGFTESKIPIDPQTFKGAKAKIKSTWGTFEEAINSIGKMSTYYKNSNPITENIIGVGFEFNDNNIVGIDLDHVLDTDGNLHEEAELIYQWLNSYTEISPSGTGLHIFIYGDIPVDGKNNRNGLEPGKGIEVYKAGHYLTMTGNVFRDLKPIEHRDAEIKSVYDKYFPQQEITQQNILDLEPAPTYQPNGEQLEQGLVYDKVLKNLWEGERSSNDESSNDQALMNKLAYWCDNDINLMIERFRASPYASQKDREHLKKMGRDDYMIGTAKEAVKGCSRTARDDHKPPTRQGKNHNPTNKQAAPLEVVTAKAIDPPMKPKAINAKWLANQKLLPVEFIVKDFLPVGLNIIASPPKFGKSFLVLDMCLSVAQGKDFLGFKTNKSGCLYLALEDSENRLQSRMLKLESVQNIPDNLHFLTEISDLSNGFREQLTSVIAEHPDIKLVVVDTLQFIRSGANNRNEGAYAADYREMRQLKLFAKEKNISIVLVHHSKKDLSLTDPFSNISGTNGITGAMDTMIVMGKEKRTDDETNLYITGRDIPQNSYVMKFEDSKWRIIGSVEDREERKAQEMYDNSPIVRTINLLISESKSQEWKGTAGDLLNEGKRLLNTHIAGSAQKLSNELNFLDPLLFRNNQIIYTPVKNGNAGKVHRFHKVIIPDTAV